MGHRGVRADIDCRALEQRAQARPIETSTHARHAGIGRPPQAVDIGLLGGVAAFSRHQRKSALGKSTRQGAPALVGPTLVAIERAGMHDGIRGARGELLGRATLGTDDIGRLLEAEGAGEPQ